MISSRTAEEKVRPGRVGIGGGARDGPAFLRRFGNIAQGASIMLDLPRAPSPADHLAKTEHTSSVRWTLGDVVTNG